MAKRNPPKTTPLTRAGQRLRAAKPRRDKAAAFVRPTAADLLAKREALHAALRAGLALAKPTPIAAPDFGHGGEADVSGDVESRNATSAAGESSEAKKLDRAGSATGSENRADLTTEVSGISGQLPEAGIPASPSIVAAEINTGGVDAASTPPSKTEPVSSFAPAEEGEKIDTAGIRPVQDVPVAERESAAVDQFPAGAPELVHPAPGAYRIEELGPDQCRFACNEAPRDGHRFCGEPTEIGPGNRWGSWCEAHRAVVFGGGTPSERRAHEVDKRVRLG